MTGDKCMILHSAHTLIGRAIGTRVNKQDPIGSMVRVQDAILNGFSGDKDFDPNITRHRSMQAAILIRTNYEEFANKCKKTKLNKEAEAKTHSQFKPAPITVA